MTAASRLILGTAQLGMPYGVMNTTGRPDPALALEIVRTALAWGIRTFDTAPGYGGAEETLGQALARSAGGEAARVVTKLPPGLDYRDAGAVRGAVQASAGRLGRTGFDLLLHEEGALDCWSEGLGDTLAQLAASGLVGRLGVSVYAPARALQALGLAGISLVQLPSNLLDARFERAGVFEAARRAGKELHVRSVFLQGLLCCDDPALLPPRLDQARTYVRTAAGVAREAGLGLRELALGYALDAYAGAGLLLGAELPAQIAANAAFAAAPRVRPAPASLRARLPGAPQSVTNPSLWPADR
ncbi:NADP-dependent oxidoreductase domain protein (plasmid) [Solidesulfovibrio carbinoliphilus subsp. oakridgensis]|uniref:NADP-dependent oxidoreductase domain protein n=1 Tax=Solidesulfovibrio carbinoliphilus subsp. oakridgensis TaxID=694327 RepID=G7QE70_9BACT|nr:aldo/keto reductase [Solidesulfovibrio carbinoliphilus]EHJ45964.1 NADP-dependent oxidoreductase domain protein [Solidesulfovibrio carbinoliphilus subsp. oakridgensis]